MKKIREQFNAKLLVEGKDDQHVIFAIRAKHNIPVNFEVVDCEGKDNVLARFPPELLRDGATTIGLVLDADQNVADVWQSLRDRFGVYNYQLPEQPPPEGFIHERQERLPRIGIWLMPDNQATGMLEDFARHLIPADNAQQPFLLETLAELERQNLHGYTAPLHRPKALIHTFLAWQSDPGTPMGAALTKTYLDHNAALCLRFVAWLNALFNAN